MAKLRYTENDNVKLTMTQEQYIVLRALLNNVVLGSSNRYESEVSDLLIDIENTEVDQDLDYFVDEVSGMLRVEIDGGGFWSIRVNGTE